MVSERAKLIRTEADITQDRMAEMLGISKKTLIEVEKGRKTFGFTSAALMIVLFRNGEIIQNLFGGSPLEVIDLAADVSIRKPWYKTMGGPVFWKEILKSGGFFLQYNWVTTHYRIIDETKYLHFYSYDEAEVKMRLSELVKTGRSI
jgi:DNA-binding XRE family transcriptional regulator